MGWQRRQQAASTATVRETPHRQRALPLLCAALAGLVLLLRPLPLQAAEVTVGLRLVPPYVTESDDGFLSGLEYELVRETLQRAGHKLVPRLLTFSRLIEDFRRGLLPAFAPAHAGMKLQGCLSDTLLIYNNIGLSLQQRNLPVESLPQLGGLRIMAFQNAHQLLPGLAAAVQGNPDYLEVANQMLQVRALFSRRTDIVLGDRRLLYALIKAPDSGIPPGIGLREHALFPATAYSVAFADAALCAVFNRALASLRASGDYERLLQRYEPYPQANGQQRGQHRVPTLTLPG